MINLGHPLDGKLLLSYKPLHLEAQQHLQEEGCVVDINKCDQYLLLGNTFVQSFHFHSRTEPLTVTFNLYDVPRDITLDEFCEACLIPPEGNPIDPHPCDVTDFISEVTMGQTRGVSEARVASFKFFSCFVLLLIICQEVFDWAVGE